MDVRDPLANQRADTAGRMTRASAFDADCSLTDVVHSMFAFTLCGGPSRRFSSPPCCRHRAAAAPDRVSASASAFRRLLSSRDRRVRPGGPQGTIPASTSICRASRRHRRIRRADWYQPVASIDLFQRSTISNRVRRLTWSLRREGARLFARLRLRRQGFLVPERLHVDHAAELTHVPVCVARVQNTCHADRVLPKHQLALDKVRRGRIRW